MKLSFLGAAKTVTGSKYLLETAGYKVLIDCGLFQGLKELRLKNWADFPLPPSKIDAVILTHAHIDHSGYIPLLVKKGFKGSIYCSPATRDLCEILLKDSGYLQEAEAERANRYGYTKHSPAKPLYTKNDAEDALKYFVTVPYDRENVLKDDLKFSLHRAGHILGSSFVKIKNDFTSILFSGDIGRPNDKVMVEPAKIQNADYIVVESTYGDRLHEKVEIEEKLAKIINSTVQKGGSVVIPAFAVGRTQTVLYYINDLQVKGKLPDVPIFLDSPMAINTTDLMCKYKNEHRLALGLCKDVCSIATATKTVEESKQILRSRVPAIIIAASGMATGGRVLHHLKHFLPDRNSTILFTGYQAAGTRGDRIIKGEKEIKIHGAWHQVRARVEQIQGLSAHADYLEILDWLANFRNTPKKVFITHGEEKSALSMQEKISSKFAWNTIVPKYLQTEEL